MAAPRPFLAATVPAPAAHAIALAFGSRIEAVARARLRYNPTDEQGLALRAAARSMREAGRQWMEGKRAEQAGERGDVLEEEPAGRWLTAAEAAKVLGVSRERVCELARTDVIRARRKGRRPWLLDEVDLLAYRDRTSRSVS